jgi:hypothetical protein
MAKKLEYSTTFEEAWSLYPKRPDNPKKPAFQKWLARINEGATILDLLTATKNYATYVRRAGKEGTEYVLMAQTFYGPAERWKAYLVDLTQKPPPSAPNRDYAPLPKTFGRTDQEAEEGLVSIREILEGLAKAKVSPVKGLKVTEG